MIDCGFLCLIRKDLAESNMFQTAAATKEQLLLWPQCNIAIKI